MRPVLFDDHKKDKFEDKEFKGKVSGKDFSRNDFRRVYAVDIVFENVNFKQVNFEECYFRNCTFIRCDFTGSKFRDCYLMGSKFPGCLFRYIVFYETLIDDGFLERYLPSEENLARDLVRALRVNFSQIGNYDGVNKAAKKEVELTGVHLYKAAYSNEGYYRSKESYSGVNRLFFLLSHARWKLENWVWGNGESIFRVVLFGVFFIFLSSFLVYDPCEIGFYDAFLSTWYEFWDVDPDFIIDQNVSVLLAAGRFLLFGLFISVLVKRMEKR